MESDNGARLVCIHGVVVAEPRVGWPLHACILFDSY